MDPLPELCHQLSLLMRTFTKNKKRKKKRKKKQRKPSGLGLLMYNFISVHLQRAEPQRRRDAEGEEQMGEEGRGGGVVSAATSLLISSQRRVKIQHDRLRQLQD